MKSAQIGYVIYSVDDLRNLTDRRRTNMNIEKRVTVAADKRIWIFVLVFASIILLIGVYLGFIKSAGYVKTTGVVVSLREEKQYDSDLGTDRIIYYPTVSYTVDGKEYTGELDIGSGFSIGEVLKIQYDPKNPSKVNSNSLVVIIIIFVIASLLIILSIFQIIRNRKDEQH